MNVMDLLYQDEGFKPKPYTDTRGKVTIGIGRNLTNVGISKLEGKFLCQNDVNMISQILSRLFPWYATFNEPRQAVVISMAFNMGISDFCQFKNTIDALAKSDFATASAEMLSSAWATEVGDRAKRLSKIMITGAYLPEQIANANARA